ncbi:MAG: hypothetical protein LBD64_00040, partial [Odoribacteraceae bacterium]|nr:hypothetical protein [Odoribacteraceae bacterium]
MKSKGSIHRGAIALLAAALAFTSCIRNIDEGNTALLEAGDSAALVTLSLTMPASPATRVVGTNVENHVEDIDVLLFTTSDNNYYYRASGMDISTDPASSA